MFTRNRVATLSLVLCGTASLVVWALFPRLPALYGPHLRDFILLYFAAFAPYLMAIFLVTRTSLPHLHTERSRSAHTPTLSSPPHTPTLSSFPLIPTLILLFAVLFRLPVLTTHPALSTDVYRYIWDGRVQNAGLNPYANRVDSSALDPLDTPNRARVNNPNMASPYLPVAQIVFAVIYRLAPESAGAFQVAAVLFDLLTGALIMLTLKKLGQPAEWALIYLWNPLVVVEFAHSAHVDAMMGLLMVAALYTDCGRRTKDDANPTVIGRLSSVTSPVLLALATLVKPLPALLLAVLVPRWGWKKTVIYAAIVVVGLIPYSGAGLGLTGDLMTGTGLFGALRIYLARWNFNGGLYHWLEVLVTGYSTQGAAPPGTPGIGLAKAISGIALLAVLGMVFLESWQRRNADGSRLWPIPIVAYLLLTPTVHPWYLAPMIALVPLSVFTTAHTENTAADKVERLPLSRCPASHPLVSLSPFLYFSASVALSYLTYLDPLNLRETESVRRGEYLPLYALLIASAIWRAARSARE